MHTHVDTPQNRKNIAVLTGSEPRSALESLSQLHRRIFPPLSLSQQRNNFFSENTLSHLSSSCHPFVSHTPVLSHSLTSSHLSPSRILSRLLSSPRQLDLSPTNGFSPSLVFLFDSHHWNYQTRSFTPRYPTIHSGIAGTKSFFTGTSLLNRQTHSTTRISTISSENCYTQTQIHLTTVRRYPIFHWRVALRQENLANMRTPTVSSEKSFTRTKIHLTTVRRYQFVHWSTTLRQEDS